MQVYSMWLVGHLSVPLVTCKCNSSDHLPMFLKLQMFSGL